MLNGLQKKWKLNDWLVLIILIVFALGGSLTGFLGMQLIPPFEIEILAFYIIIYFLLVSTIWPAAVLLVSIPFGQFFFSGSMKQDWERGYS